jgi:hypothetical protein
VKRWSYTVLGNKRAATAALVKEMEYSGGSPEDAGWKVIAAQVEAIDADKQAAVKKLQESLTDMSVRDNPYGFGYEIALAYNAVGDATRAIEWLARSEAAGGHSFNFIAADPRLTHLREEPAFADLLNKLLPTVP